MRGLDHLFKVVSYHELNHNMFGNVEIHNVEIHLDTSNFTYCLL